MHFQSKNGFGPKKSIRDFGDPFFSDPSLDRILTGLFRLQKNRNPSFSDPMQLSLFIDPVANAIKTILLEQMVLKIKAII